ncbi:YkvA family protein [Methylocaldum sp.]|uniref:YkvA family protein n=1 Tax=Methylocaldum sp. TaxID=1969727 RepID=UPI002D66514E|nr:YkvA family protein [Methylocaldum sp.]HYE34267.1 YkvA family protein [Methylocaldum sp.]
MSLFIEFKQRVRRLKAETFALYLAARHPRTPWYAKFLAAAIVAYAFSPIDLIPDFIPVLGYLDDLVLIPLGLALVIRLIPSPILAECRAAAVEIFTQRKKPVSYAAAGFVVIIWLMLAAWGMAWIYEALADKPIAP